MHINCDIKSEIGDETVLWMGNPSPGVKFRPFDLLLIPFSLMWGGLAIFMMIGMITTGTPIVFPLFATPFVLVGIYLIIGRFLFDAYRRKNTFYAVTKSRVIFLSKIPNKNITSIDLYSIGEINVKEGGDGSGTIAFGDVSFFSIFNNMHKMAMWSFWNGGPFVPSFEFIENVRKVYNILVSARDERCKSLTLSPPPSPTT